MKVAERFAAETAVELDDEGVIRHAVVEFDLDEPSAVTIRCLAANRQRPQALVLDTDEPMMMTGSEATRVRLWADATPETVTIEAPAGRLTIWNEWRHAGTVHAWLGNAHLRVEGDQPIVVTAVDGLSESDAEDLVVELRFGLALAVD